MTRAILIPTHVVHKWIFWILKNLPSQQKKTPGHMTRKNYPGTDDVSVMAAH